LFEEAAATGLTRKNAKVTKKIDNSLFQRKA
jgi:hypothetical protein